MWTELSQHTPTPFCQTTGNAGDSNSCAPSQTTAAECYSPVATTLWVVVGILAAGVLWLLYKIGFFGAIYRLIKRFNRRNIERLLQRFPNLRKITNNFYKMKGDYNKQMIDSKNAYKQEYMKQIKQYRENMQQAGKEFKQNVTDIRKIVDQAMKMAKNSHSKKEFDAKIRGIENVNILLSGTLPPPAYGSPKFHDSRTELYNPEALPNPLPENFH